MKNATPRALLQEQYLWFDDILH